MPNCIYEDCPAKRVNEHQGKELDRLIDAVRGLTKMDKQISEEVHQYRLHHFEMLNQQTKQGGMLVELAGTVEEMKTDRQVKHIELNTKLDKIFTKIESLDTIQKDQSVDMKMINWKLAGVYAVASGIAYVIWTKVKSVFFGL